MNDDEVPTKEFTSAECMEIAHNKIRVQVSQDIEHVERLGVIVIVVDRFNHNAGWVASIDNNSVTMTLQGILSKKVN